VSYPYLIQNNYKSLSEILEKSHDYRNALHYFKQHSNYKDSLSNIQVLENRNRLEVEFETEKKEKEILIQRAQIAEKQLEIEQKNIQILGVLFLLAISVLVGIQLYSRQVQKNIRLKKEKELNDALTKIEIQNQLQEQRLRISRDLHDNIGSQLTFVISSIDNLKYQFKDQNPQINTKLNEINEFTKNTIVELRDTIWAMNKDYISFEDLKIRISNFIEKAESMVSEIDFSFYIDQSLMDRQMSAFEGINIYRIIQEGINNSIKHANPTLISVMIKQVNQKTQILIEDNGNGFEKDSSAQGSGLANIKKRVGDINGVFTIVSAPKDGTKISITY
jgi:signal transduction histidine kinase